LPFLPKETDWKREAGKEARRCGGMVGRYRLEISLVAAFAILTKDQSVKLVQHQFVDSPN